MKPKAYTVVLLRPQYMCDETGETYGNDIYVAAVKGLSHCDAIKRAQREVFESDKEDGLGIISPSDYKLCVLFEGKHEPALFGWQAY